MATKDYTIGYGKPPEGSRFRKGQSGNPAGRPRGSKNLATLIDQVMSEPVIVNENGKRKKISSREAMIKRLRNQALSGDTKSIQILLPEIRSIDERRDSSASEGGRLDEADRQVLLQIQKRLERTPQTGGNQNGTEL